MNRMNNDQNKQVGQVLPLCTLLLSFLVILSFMLIKDINLQSQRIYDNEAAMLNESHSLVQTHLSLNGLVLNNLKLRRQLSQLLQIIESTLSRGMLISAAALPWEEKLPIPHPYNIFKELTEVLHRTQATALFIAQGQIKLRRSINIMSDIELTSLSLGQSLCQLPCLAKTHVQLSNYNCNTFKAGLDSCSITPRYTHVIPSHLRTLPLKSVVPFDLWNAPGFLSIRMKSQALSKNFKRGAGVAEIVHPALCGPQKANSTLPCPSSEASRSTAMSNEHQLSFLPHWSISIEAN